MIQIFDMFNNPEKPQIILTKPTGEEIFEIGEYTNLNIKGRYNDISEITFTVLKSSFRNEDYEEIKGKKYVTVANYGIYIINDVVDFSDGIIESKDVVCKSVEFELSYKRITLEPTTYKLYDPVSPDGTLMKRIIDLVPSWSIGTIDTSVANQFRYFDIEDKTILQFLFSDLEDAYQSVVEFDYFNREISIVAIDNVGTNSDIYISHDNLMESVKTSEISEEIVTDLYVYGGNGLNIIGVNPAGRSNISNINYFKTTEWIDQDLIDELDNYEVLYASQESSYNGLLTSLKTKNGELLVLQTELNQLNADLTALETLQRERIQAGVPIGTLYNDITLKQTEIISKNNEITNKQSEISVIVNSLLSIVDSLSLENNFTQQQIEDLDKLTIEYTYQNEAYMITDSMTAVEIQEQEELLLSEARKILARLSQPRYSFTIGVADFLKVSDYETFIEQFELATIINIELANGQVIESRLISYDHDWDNNGLTLEFTSKYRNNDPTYLYNELFKKGVDAGISVSFSKYIYNNWDRENKDIVTEFRTSALNATLNNLISTASQDFIIDSNGWRGRQSDGAGGYLPEQVWMTNNMLSFTKDSWRNASLALGKIIDPITGASTYGLVADTIVGSLIAGNSLVISDTVGTFVVDNNGAVLTNASLTVTTSDNKGRIILDPTQGIKIQGNSTGTFQDGVYIGTDGRIKANSIDILGDGTFGGTVSASTILASNFLGGYININNNFIVDSLGNMTAVNGTFSGSITGNNNSLSGSLQVGTDLFLTSEGFGGSIYYNKISPTYGDMDCALRIGHNDVFELFSDADIEINGVRSITLNPDYNGWYGSKLYYGSRFDPNNEVATLGDIPSGSDGTVRDVIGSTGINVGGFTTIFPIISIDEFKVVTQPDGTQNIEIQYFSDHIEVRSNGGAWKTINFD